MAYHHQPKYGSYAPGLRVDPAAGTYEFKDADSGIIPFLLRPLGFGTTVRPDPIPSLASVPSSCARWALARRCAGFFVETGSLFPIPTGPESQA
eukprot:6791014-Prymnesium_polylepis.2